MSQDRWLGATEAGVAGKKRYHRIRVEGLGVMLVTVAQYYHLDQHTNIHALAPML